jgi:hypothetical protein
MRSGLNRVRGPICTELTFVTALSTLILRPPRYFDSSPSMASCYQYICPSSTVLWFQQNALPIPAHLPQQPSEHSTREARDRYQYSLRSARAGILEAKGECQSRYCWWVVVVLVGLQFD